MNGEAERLPVILRETPHVPRLQLLHSSAAGRAPVGGLGRRRPTGHMRLTPPRDLSGIPSPPYQPIKVQFSQAHRLFGPVLPCDLSGLCDLVE
jgi:hypothetical protein